MSASARPLQSEDDLLHAFRPRDRKHVFLPPDLKFPVELNPVFVWLEPSGVRVYLLAHQVHWEAPVGIAFRRDQKGSPSSPPGMCDWCLSTGSSDQIGLLTASVDSRRRVGVNLCLDLGCMRKLEGFAEASGMRLEQVSVRYFERMERFFRRALEMEL